VLVKDEGSRNSTYQSLAKAQAKLGDIIGANETVHRIARESDRDSALAEIGAALANFGNFKAAQKIIDKIKSQNNKDSVYGAIATRQAEQGDTATAKVTAAKIQGDPDYRLFQAMTKAGEISWAQQAVSGLKSNSWRDSFYGYIAEAQSKSGDLAGAKKAAELVMGDYYKSVICGAIAEAGDISWATDCAARIKGNSDRVNAYLKIAKARARQGKTAAAQKNGQQLEKRRPEDLSIDKHSFNAGGYRRCSGSLRNPGNGAKERF
jgi:hypothetical protein